MEDIIVGQISSEITVESLDTDQIDISVEVQTLTNLTDLSDVNTSNLDPTTNAFVLSYNATTNKFEFVNPDSVIDSAINVGGLSTSTISYFGNTLDNEIDLDGGEF